MKFRIKDEDGKDYEVEEIIEEKSEENATTPKEPVVETKDEELSLSQDEIKSLKDLAAVAPKLLELLQVEEKEHEENPDLVDADEDESDDEDNEMNDSDEEVIETCEEKSTHDSKSSFGALASKKTSCDDSLEDEVSIAWAKRYGGIK